jgi:hypothetical protein
MIGVEFFPEVHGVAVAFFLSKSHAMAAAT